MNNFDDIKKWVEDTLHEPLEKMDSFFNSRVESYDEHMSPWASYYKETANLIPKDSKELLDIGCGTGLELEEIFKIKPDICVTGIDMSKDMLALLKRKYIDKKIKLICKDYFIADFGTSDFDTALSFQTLHHFKPEKKLLLFKKIYTALKSGGTYVECDYTAATTEMEKYLFDALDRKREIRNLSKEVFVHFDTPLTAEHEVSLLYAAGFNKVDIVKQSSDKFTSVIKAYK